MGRADSETLKARKPRVANDHCMLRAVEVYFWEGCLKEPGNMDLAPTIDPVSTSLAAHLKI